MSEMFEVFTVTLSVKAVNCLVKLETSAAPVIFINVAFIVATLDETLARLVDRFNKDDTRTETLSKTVVVCSNVEVSRLDTFRILVLVSDVRVEILLESVDTSVVILEFIIAASLKDCNEILTSSFVKRFDTLMPYVCRSPVITVSPFTSVVIRDVNVASPVVRRLEALFRMVLVWERSVVTRVDKLFREVDKVDKLVLVTVFKLFTCSST